MKYAIVIDVRIILFAQQELLEGGLTDGLSKSPRIPGRQ
jgi:glycerol dehydrogenase-like iron-containing ADH family enzyme